MSGEKGRFPGVAFTVIDFEWQSGQTASRPAAVSSGELLPTAHVNVMHLLMYAFVCVCEREKF